MEALLPQERLHLRLHHALLHIFLIRPKSICNQPLELVNARIAKIVPNADIAAHADNLQEAGPETKFATLVFFELESPVVFVGVYDGHESAVDGEGRSERELRGVRGGDDAAEGDGAGGRAVARWCEEVGFAL